MPRNDIRWQADISGIILVYKLENVQWLVIPLQIGDPMVAPPGEYVRKKYRHPGFAIADSYSGKGRRSEVDSWKTAHPSAKVAQEV